MVAEEVTETADATAEAETEALDNAVTEAVEAIVEAVAELAETKTEEVEAEEAVAEEAAEATVETEVAEEVSVAVEGVVETPPAPLRPGDISETSIAVWAPDRAEAFRVHLREVQAGFVDDPALAVSQAQALVTDAVRALAEALLNEQLNLDPRRRSENPDTESLRIALRGYKDFLERVLAL